MIEKRPCVINVIGAKQPQDRPDEHVHEPEDDGSR